MKACLIPPRGLEQFALMSDMHLALAIPATVDNPDYVSTYKTAIDRGDFVIVDNGAAEGVRVGNRDLLDAATSVIPANEVVAPDELQDAAATLALVDEFILKHVQDMYKIDVMAVPQATTEKDFKRCVHIFESYPEIRTLGIPRHMLATLRNSLARIKLCIWIDENYPGRFNLHALGVDPRHLFEISALAKDTNVRSIDSALPFNYALKKVILSDTDMPPITRHRDYFGTDWQSVVTTKLLRDNINTFRRWAAGE